MPLWLWQEIQEVPRAVNSERRQPLFFGHCYRSGSSEGLRPRAVPPRPESHTLARDHSTGPPLWRRYRGERPLHGNEFDAADVADGSLRADRTDGQQPTPRHANSDIKSPSEDLPASTITVPRASASSIATLKASGSRCRLMVVEPTASMVGTMTCLRPWSGSGAGESVPNGQRPWAWVLQRSRRAPRRRIAKRCASNASMPHSRLGSHATSAVDPMPGALDIDHWHANSPSRSPHVARAALRDHSRCGALTLSPLCSIARSTATWLSTDRAPVS